MHVVAKLVSLPSGTGMHDLRHVDHVPPDRPRLPGNLD